MNIPATVEEDYAYFTPDQTAAIARYYDDNGYVVVRGLIPAGLCRSAMSWFNEEVKPYAGFIYRQTTANPERHTLTPDGFMLNPILNVQSLDARRFPNFRNAGLAVLTDHSVQRVLRAMLGEAPKLVQSMYFEGNPTTWAHQDTYYLDAENLGAMIGGWFAVEDIAPGAGRFFVYPTSHRIDVAKNGGGIDVAFNHGQYKALVIDLIRQYGLECRAPALRRGDVLFWSSKTMHGSLDTTEPRQSRSSFTGHYIPDSARFVQFQSRIRGLSLRRVAGMRVHSPKDLNKASRRAVFWIETTFPTAFRATKKVAIKAMTR
jgi:phytanoyl-CoA hydroxylase